MLKDPLDSSCSSPSAVTRISCVAYMANFVARAQFVSLRSEALCTRAFVYAVAWFVCVWMVTMCCTHVCRIAQECLSVLTQWVHQ